MPRAPNLSDVFYLRLIFESSKELGNVSCVLQVKRNLKLDVLYQLGYFYVMCWEYGDSDSCRC